MKYSIVKSKRRILVIFWLKTALLLLSLSVIAGVSEAHTVAVLFLLLLTVFTAGCSFFYFSGYAGKNKIIGNFVLTNDKIIVKKGNETYEFSFAETQIILNYQGYNEPFRSKNPGGDRNRLSLRQGKRKLDFLFAIDGKSKLKHLYEVLMHPDNNKADIKIINQDKMPVR